MIGIQRRHLNDRTIARIVTREQAVLDTLHRPLSCGGASVVWEVWQAALQDLDLAKLAQMAGRLSDSRWRRRAAFMIATLSSGSGAAVESFLRDVRLEVGARSESGAIQLMPGIAGGVIDSDWGLEVPA